MTFSRPKRSSSKKSKRSLDFLPEGEARDRYLAQIKAQGVDVSKIGAPKKTGRYRVSAKEDRTVDGIVFDSKLESQVYALLRDTIGLSNMQMQEPFELQPAFEFEGKKYRASHYVADFVITLPDGEHVIDVKGHLTAEFKEKRKQFLFRYRRPLHLLYSISDVQKFLEAHAGSKSVAA